LLDVVIGVVFVWFLLSVMLSGVNEAFTLVTHIRAKHLWLGIGRLLDPARSKLPTRFLDATIGLPVMGRFDLRPVTAPGEGRQNGFVRFFTGRPDAKADDDTRGLRARTNLLYTKLEPQIVETAQPGRLSKITHVAGAAVAEAIVSLASRVHRNDLIQTAEELGWSEDERQALGRSLSGVPEGGRLSVDELLKLPTGGTILTESALRDVHAQASERLTGRDFADALHDNPELGDAVRRAVAGLEGAAKVKAAKEAIAAHFDREMDQVSRFYRRQNRKILAVLALVTVLVFQANAVALALDIWKDSSLRTAVVGGALTAAAGDSLDRAVQKGCEKAGTTTSTTGAAAPATTSTTAVATTTTTDPVVEAEEQLRCAASIYQKLSAFHLGLGWSDFKKAHDTGAPQRAEWADVPPYLTERWGLVGRALTAIALLFGAQFWFDVLRRLVGLRRPASAAPPSSA
jgi:hypothetical protein